ncbi:MAG: ABC transporter permease [Thaumarchaeota archaeon]|nr:ABC transporter permease [Nitrososphaerota archaeon]
MNIFRYIGRRLILAIFVLLCVSIITFILSHGMGGNPVCAWLGRLGCGNPSLVAEYTSLFHLKDPIYVQYFYYLGGLLNGNLGISPSRQFAPVSTVVATTLPYTIQIAFFAIIITIVLGVLLGVLASLYHHRAADKGIRTLYLAGYSSPSFLMALILIIVFVYFFRLLPNGGSADLSLNTPGVITGIPMLDSLLEGNFAYFVSSLQHVILPSLALALTTFGVVTRVLRSSMLDTMHANYIRTARAKGLDEGTVFFKHGLRNAMIPVVTLSSLIVTWLITGTVFVEAIFGYPGLGQYLVSALQVQDYPGILAATLIFAIIIVLANLAADIFYAIVDPQIRLG